MDEKKEKEKAGDEIRERFGRGMMKGLLTDDMKEGLKKGIKRVLAVSILTGIGAIVFVTVYAFLWSSNYTFYQNLVVTFDALVVALVIGLALIYKVSGIGEIMKKFSGMAEKLAQKEKPSEGTDSRGSSQG